MAIPISDHQLSDVLPEKHLRYYSTLHHSRNISREIKITES